MNFYNDKDCDLVFKQIVSTKNAIKYSKSLNLSEILKTDVLIYKEILESGHESSAPHYHRNIDEIIILQKGKLRVCENKIKKDIFPGDIICFKAGEKKFHYLENVSHQKAEYLVIKSKVDYDDVVYFKETSL